MKFAFVEALLFCFTKDRLIVAYTYHRLAFMLLGYELVFRCRLQHDVTRLQVWRLPHVKLVYPRTGKKKGN